MLYYITYEYKYGTGATIIHRNKKINTLRDINELSRTIKEENKCDGGVIITNWKRLKGVV